MHFQPSSLHIFCPFEEHYHRHQGRKKVVFTSQVLMYDALPLLKQSQLKFEVFEQQIKICNFCFFTQ
jgi:hypothetical protein